ncbi:MAG: hypothetical protein HRT88_22740, partial [Lentisphaeraceae bacterium]|nr:hypothetical protein [Lentisphaeraceae bacterium]
MIFKCPGCEITLEAPAESIGGRVECTHCEFKFVLEDKLNTSPTTEKKQQTVRKPGRKTVYRTGQKAVYKTGPKRVTKKKSKKKTGVIKLLLGFCLIMIGALVGLTQWGRTSLNGAPANTIAAAVSYKATTTNTAPNLFDFDKWSKEYGQSLDVNDWLKENP